MTKKITSYQNIEKLQIFNVYFVFLPPSNLNKKPEITLFFSLRLFVKVVLFL